MVLKITLLFRDFLIKTVDNSYSNFELYLNFQNLAINVFDSKR